MTRVLVIDDDHEYRHIVRDYLENLGYHVDLMDHSTNVPEAVIAHEPDVILLDFVMPVRTGPEVMAELQQLHLERPLVLVTGLPLTTEELAGTVTLVKPFDLTEVVHAIEKVLS
jgi:DNA-binding response OmpR family regulator